MDAVGHGRFPQLLGGEAQHLLRLYAPAEAPPLIQRQLETENLHLREELGTLQRPGTLIPNATPTAEYNRVKGSAL